MKCRVLYPTVTESQGIEGLAGSVVNVEDALAAALIAEGALEPADAKAPVERATAAPGERRPVGRPKNVDA